MHCDRGCLEVSIPIAGSDVNASHRERFYCRLFIEFFFFFNFAVYRSCKDIYNAEPSSVSGVFELEIGKHYCLMERSNSACGEGGWTLALKVDGTKVNIPLYLQAFQLRKFLALTLEL